MKKYLVDFVKTIFSDTRKTIFTLVLVSLVGGFAGLLKLSKMLLDFLLFFLSAPIPLWATITLFVLSCIYTYLKLMQIQAKASQSNISRKYVEYQPTPGVFVYVALGKSSPWYCKHCADLENIESTFQMINHFVQGKYYQCHKCQFKFKIPN